MTRLVPALCAGLIIAALPAPLGAQTAEQAVRFVTERGGRVVRDVEAPGQPVIAVDLSYTATADRDLDLLTALGQFRELNLEHTTVTSAAMKAVVRLKGLRTLNVSGTFVGNDGVRALVALADLRELHLDGVRVDGEGLKDVVRLPKLERLHYTGWHAMNRDALAELVKAPGLRELRLAHCRLGSWRPPLKPADPRSAGPGLGADLTSVPVVSLRWLTELPRLEVLDLSDNLIGDADVAVLAGIKTLRTLRLSGNHLSPASLDALARLPGLEVLALDVPVSDATVTKAAALKKLRALTLIGPYEGTRLTRAGFAALGGLRELRSLVLSTGEAEEPDWRDLAGLEELGLHVAAKDRWPGAGLCALTRLRKLHTGTVQAKALAALEGLECLWVPLGDADLKYLKGMKRLQTLNGVVPSEAGIAELVEMKSLRKLTLRVTKITDSGVKLLTQLPHLEDLDIGCNDGVTEVGLRTLAGCPSLRRLSLDCLHSRLTLPMLEAVAGLKQLRDLNLGGRFDSRVGLTADELRVLSGCRHLARLWVSNVTQKEHEAIARALPGCYVP